MTFYRCLALCLFLLAVVGCGGGAKEEVKQNAAVAPAELVKAILKGVSENGQDLGSGADSLSQAIEELKQADAAKGNAVAQGFKELTTARDPASRKSAAKKMMSKL